MIWLIPRTILSKKTFLALDFLKPGSVIMIDSSEKTKMKNSISFWFPPQIFLKHFSPYLFFDTLSSPIKKEWEGVKNYCVFI